MTVALRTTSGLPLLRYAEQEALPGMPEPQPVSQPEMQTLYRGVGIDPGERGLEDIGWSLYGKPQDSTIGDVWGKPGLGRPQAPQPGPRHLTTEEAHKVLDWINSPGSLKWHHNLPGRDQPEGKMVPQGYGLGPHWSTNPEVAKDAATLHPDWNLGAVIEADWPKGVREDPHTEDLKNYGLSDKQVEWEAEQRLMSGAPLNVRRMHLWHPKLKEWKSYDFDEPLRYTAAPLVSWENHVWERDQARKKLKDKKKRPVPKHPPDKDDPGFWPLVAALVAQAETIVAAPAPIEDLIDTEGLYRNALGHWDNASDEEREQGAQWYPAAREWLGNLSGQTNRDYSRSAAMLAALSPRQDWDTNLSTGAHFLLNYDPENKAQWLRQDPKNPQRQTGTGMPGLGENITRAMRIHEAPRAKILDELGDGPKVNHFYRNFMGDDDAVTIDTHMARALNTVHGGPAADADSSLAPLGIRRNKQWAGYEAYANAVRRAAQERNVSPSTMQAAIWLKFKNDLDRTKEQQKHETWDRRHPGKPYQAPEKGPLGPLKFPLPDYSKQSDDPRLPEPHPVSAPGYHRPSRAASWVMAADRVLTEAETLLAGRPYTPEEMARHRQKGWRGEPCEDCGHHGVIGDRCADCGKRVAPQRAAAYFTRDELRELGHQYMREHPNWQQRLDWQEQHMASDPALYHQLGDFARRDLDEHGLGPTPGGNVTAVTDLSDDWQKHTAATETDLLPESSGLTAIPGTLPTYLKAHDLLEQAGAPQGPTLDYGAGRGLSHDELGFDTFEPNPRPGEHHTYTRPKDIPDASYGRVMNLNVLNVVPPGIRHQIVKDIGRVMAPGGHAIITTRGRDVLKSRPHPDYEQPSEPMSMITGNPPRYQKGFTRQELGDYIQKTLGPGYSVHHLPLGPAGVRVVRDGH